jgi:hypothetical protein
MKDKSIETQEKLPEDDRELQRKVKDSVKRWGRASCYLGLALIISSQEPYQCPIRNLLR